MSELTDNEKKIIKQIEYYFDDINLMKDRFLRGELEKDDGWISFETLLTFNRLKAMTNDPELIKNSIMKSTRKFLEVRDDAVRRVHPFVATEDEDIFDRFANETVYAKGFGSDATLEVLENWFNEIGTVPKSIHLRRFPRDKKFKGSIFATFSSHEEAKKFLDCEEGGKFKGNCVIRKWQKDYKIEKDEERNAREEEKSKRQELQEKARRKEAEARMTKGALLELSGLPEKEKRPAGEKRKAEEDGDNDREEDAPRPNQILDFKAWASEQLGEELSKGMWLDMQPDDNKVVLRFKAEDSATKAQEILKEKGLKYKDHELKPRILGGDEEIDYWTTYMSVKGNKSHKRNQGHGKRRRRA